VQFFRAVPCLHLLAAVARMDSQDALCLVQSFLCEERRNNFVKAC
jgi:hypothetical protein